MDILGSGPLTVDEVVNQIRIQSRDGASGNPVFSDDEIKLALRQAIINARNKYFRSGTYDLDYTQGTDSYTLPPDIEIITDMTRVRTNLLSYNPVNSLMVSMVDEDVHAFRHLYSRESNLLMIRRQYPTGTFRIYYYQNTPVPIESRVLYTALATDDTSMVLVDAAPQLYKLVLPAWFKIDDEIIKVTAVASNTTCTIERGAFDSIAATHINGSAVAQCVFADSDAFYNYLYTEIGRLLNAWRTQSGASTEVAANITASRIFAQDKEEHFRRDKQSRRQSKITFSRNRHPRRSL